MYMTSVQPSSDTHWKMVSHDHKMLSKDVKPKLGLASQPPLKQ